MRDSSLKFISTLKNAFVQNWPRCLPNLGSSSSILMNASFDRIYIKIFDFRIFDLLQTCQSVDLRRKANLFGSLLSN